MSEHAVPILLSRITIITTRVGPKKNKLKKKKKKKKQTKKKKQKKNNKKPKKAPKKIKITQRQAR
jgi:hypothetical protein